MRDWRCLLGNHDPVQTKLMRQPAYPRDILMNAVCRRCGKEGWVGDWTRIKKREATDA